MAGETCSQLPARGRESSFGQECRQREDQRAGTGGAGCRPSAADGWTWV